MIIARRRRACKREHFDGAWHQKPERVDAMHDPGGVGYDSAPFPVRNLFHADGEVFPHGACIHAGEVRAELIIHADLAVLLDGCFDCGNEDVLIVFFCHKSACTDADNFAGEFFQEFKHGALLGAGG